MFLMNFKSSLVKNKSTCLLRRSIVSSSCCRSAKISSENTENTNAERKDVETYRPLSEDEIQKIINLDNIHIVTKFQQKLPQRPPLIKNFFIGKIDVEHLTYPQVMEVKDFNAMTEKLQPIDSYFADSARTPVDLRFRDVSNQMLGDFRNLNLFAASVHQRFGGLGYFKSEMNWASECEANDIKSFFVLAGHRLAVEAISDHGNLSHHNQYLMDMAKGEIIGATCLHDPLNKTEPQPVKVEQTPDGDYVLNGSKSFVPISQHVNLLIVVAEKSDELKREFEVDEEDDDEYFDAYLTIVLDPKSSGITIVDQCEKMIGCNDVPFATVNFSNVHVSKSQILSEGLDDRKISQKLVTSSRLQSATLNLIQAKNMLKQLINFSISAEINSQKLRDLLHVRYCLAKLACDVYGLESMIYLNAGIIDQYDNPKVDLECAVTKAYSQDILWNLTRFAMDLIDTPVTIEGHPIDLDIRNAIQLQYHETSSSLKSYAGRVGLQHAMDHFGKNAHSYKDSIWVKFGLNNMITIEDVKEKHFLGDYLHPSLMEAATELESSIQRVQFSSEMLLNRYGDSINERIVEIHDLGEALMQCYAMFTSLARSSRAYCIGLRHSKYETVAAGCLVQAYSRNILKMALEIKHNRNGYGDLYKTVTENALRRHRNQSIVIPSVLQSGVVQKVVV
ncbi:complex I assembly factor ACAD9, mitochondrial-like [Sitodiplosis mosellana]|uniref:complex I assembly factor ACAD9, mitochondrial-like n=1 Tax=Sitodiplosis mosellana TaxID=263140 RepID=UPI0024442D71|nr:complex I assembly factor ACAD9, mitochondrial-like [Sitodiplosis mosellana]